MEVPTRTELRKLKVVELRQRLSKLSLPQGGIKEDLISRLIKHYEEEREAAQQQQQEEQQQQQEEEEVSPEREAMMVSIEVGGKDGVVSPRGKEPPAPLPPPPPPPPGEPPKAMEAREATPPSQQQEVQAGTTPSQDGEAMECEDEEQRPSVVSEQAEPAAVLNGETAMDQTDAPNRAGLEVTSAPSPPLDQPLPPPPPVEQPLSPQVSAAPEPLPPAPPEQPRPPPQVTTPTEVSQPTGVNEHGSTEAPIPVSAPPPQQVALPPQQVAPPPQQVAPPPQQVAPPPQQVAPPPQQVAPPPQQVAPPPQQVALPPQQMAPPPQQVAPPPQLFPQPVAPPTAVHNTAPPTLMSQPRPLMMATPTNIPEAAEIQATVSSDYYSASDSGIGTAREEERETSASWEWSRDVPPPPAATQPPPRTVREGPRPVAPAPPAAEKGEKRKRKKKKRRRRRHDQEQSVQEPVPAAKESAVEVEYIQEDILKPGDPNYRQFHKILESFRISEPAEASDPSPNASQQASQADKGKRPTALKDLSSDESEEEEKKEEPKMSKKKLRKLSRLTVAQLKQLVERPDVVEMHDVTAMDPKLLIHLKSSRNTVPVPRHWCFKRKYLQGKRGIEKPPFDLPDFIKSTGVMEMRQALEDKEDAKSLKQKTRERVRPKMGKLTIDYQKLHDAFFKWQTKPKMTIHGDMYYEGKEFETRLRQKKPGDLSDELRRALGMPTGLGKHKFPPPWLVAMQRYGPPPSYPNLKIPGLNAAIPENCSFGYFVGGWGKPPVDEVGRPLYGDVFGLEQQEVGRGVQEEEEVDATLWGELESEEEDEDEEEESEEEGSPKPEDIAAGLITPMEGLVTPSGLTSIPAGLETPDMIQLRKKKIEEAMEQGGETPALYTVIPEKPTSVGGAMMGSSYTYDVGTGGGSAPKKAGAVEVALDPSELDLDTATIAARYEEQVREKRNAIQKEDLSDMVAEHAAKQKKRKRATADSTAGGKAAKKFKF